MFSWKVSQVWVKGVFLNLENIVDKKEIIKKFNNEIFLVRKKQKLKLNFNNIYINLRKCYQEMNKKQLLINLTKIKNF